MKVNIIFNSLYGHIYRLAEAVAEGTLLHHGMIIVGVPYSEKRQMTLDEITGGSPYGASTIAGPDGSRQPSENELAIARFQGRWVAEITKRLVGK